jgi:hypothetical protein
MCVLLSFLLYCYVVSLFSMLSYCLVCLYLLVLCLFFLLFSVPCYCIVCFVLFLCVFCTCILITATGWKPNCSK